MKKWMFYGIAPLMLVLGAFVAWAQPPGFGFGPPGGRIHTKTQKEELRLVPATTSPRVRNQVSISVVGDQRIIRANGVPDHKTGAFPNRGNPNRIVAQRYEYRIPARPRPAESITPLGMHNFGIAINGVPFDPGAAEFFRGQRGSKWQYEPLSGAIELGIDVSHAHVQPTGAYHYHGLPTNLLADVKLDASEHSPLIGWAADGFPMYAVYGYEDPVDESSPIRNLQSSYRLKEGERPGTDDPRSNEPSGTYDGTFVADYEFVEGSGDLDECNGRWTVTPDFPDGTYAYFLTEDWPVIPRNYRGTPSSDFLRRGPGGPPGGPGGPGGARRGPPPPGGPRPAPGRRPRN